MELRFVTERKTKKTTTTKPNLYLGRFLRKARVIISPQSLPSLLRNCLKKDGECDMRNTTAKEARTVAGKNQSESQNLQHKHKLKTESQNLQQKQKTQNRFTKSTFVLVLRILRFCFKFVFVL